MVIALANDSAYFIVVYTIWSVTNTFFCKESLFFELLPGN